MSGTTLSWTTTDANGNWNSADWTKVSGASDTYPQSADTALLAGSAAYNVDVGTVTNAATTLTITDASATLAFNNSASVLNISGTTTISGGKLFFTVAGGTFSSNEVTMSAGTLTSTLAGTISIGSGGLFLSGTGTFTPSKGVFNDTGGVTVAAGLFTDDATTSTIGGAVSFNGGTDEFGGTSGVAIGLSSTLTIGTTAGAILKMGLGTITVSGATTLFHISTMSMLGGTVNATNSGIVDNGTVSGYGTVEGALTFSAGTGLVEASAVSGNGTLDLTSAIGSSTGLAYKIGAIATATQSVLELAGSVATGNTFTFTSATSGALQLADFTTISGDSLNFTGATISGMAVGTSTTVATDEIIVGNGTTNPSNVSAIYTTSSETTGTLTIYDANGTNTIATISMTGLTGSNTGAEAADWIAGTGGTTDIFLSTAICFAAGTRILTDRGEVAVETLSEGDLVVTRDGTQRPVKWLGHRKIDLTRHVHPSLAAPVRILRNAFGQDLPHRDLVVSPDHCLFVDGKLIPAKLLINDMTIVQERGAKVVEYYHVELDRHAILLAENLPAESYLDTGNRAFFSNAGLALVLHPEFHVNAGLKCWEVDACAPLAVSQEAVAPVWHSLAERGRMLGYQRPEFVTTADPELRIVADGRVIRPLSRHGDRYVFALPAGASAIRLTSRTSVPAHFQPYADDWRMLGVAVRRIAVRSDSGLVELPPDHPGLTQGWYAVERDDAAMWRWMSGDAVLPLPPSSESAMVEIQVGISLPYILDNAGEDRLAA